MGGNGQRTRSNLLGKLCVQRITIRKPKPLGHTNIHKSARNKECSKHTKKVMLVRWRKLENYCVMDVNSRMCVTKEIKLCLTQICNRRREQSQGEVEMTGR